MFGKRRDGFCICGHVLNEIRGEMVCSVCGLVDCTVIMSPGKHNKDAYSLNTYRKKKKGLTGYIDFKKSSKKLKSAIISGINNETVDGVIELSELITSQLGLSGSIKERVCFLIRQLPRKYIFNRNKTNSILATIYIVMLEYNYMRMYVDLKKYIDCDKNVFFKLVNKIKKELNIPHKFIDVQSMIKIISARLNLNIEKTYEICNKVTDEISSMGNTLTTACSILYLYNKKLFKELRYISDVSEYNLRTKITKLKKVINNDR